MLSRIGNVQFAYAKQFSTASQGSEPWVPSPRIDTGVTSVVDRPGCSGGHSFVREEVGRVGSQEVSRWQHS